MCIYMTDFNFNVSIFFLLAHYIVFLIVIVVDVVKHYNTERYRAAALNKTHYKSDAAM